MEQVRQILGYGTRIQVDAFLQAHEIYDYTPEDLNRDMATLDKLLTVKAGRFRLLGIMIVVADTSRINPVCVELCFRSA